MSDDSQAPADKAVLAFFEIVAFALGWGGVDRLLDGRSRLSVLPIFAATILTSYAGFMWPQIRERAAPWLFAPRSRPFWTAVFFVCSLCVFQILAGPELTVRMHQRWHSWIDYVTVAILGAVLACGYWWLAGVVSKPSGKIAASAAPAVSDEKPPTLLDLFKSDFGNTMKVTDTNGPAYQVHAPDGAKVDVRRQVYMDFPARTKFIGFYVHRPSPLSPDFKAEKTVAACLQLLQINAVKDSFDQFGKQVGVMGGQGGQMTTAQDLTFSGRVLIYHEEFLSITQKADIINAYRAKSLDVQFMGDEYLGAQVIAWHQRHDSKAAGR
jgi:hypothetical protein